MSIDLTKENSFQLAEERSKCYPAQTIMYTDYAYDIALLANTPAWAETLLHSLEQAAGVKSVHSTDTWRNTCALIKEATYPH